MKQIFKFLFIVFVSIVSMQSCIDKDYDDINKGGVIPIPPVRLTIDPIDIGVLKELPGITIPPGYSASVAVSDTIYDVFSGDAVKDFFYDGAEKVEVEFLIDNELTEVALSNASVKFRFNVLDEEKKTIVSLPEQSLTLNASGKFEEDKFVVSFTASDMPKMQLGATDLEIIVVASIKSGSTIHFGAEDKLVFKSLTMKTSGMYFEF